MEIFVDSTKHFSGCKKGHRPNSVAFLTDMQGRTRTKQIPMTHVPKLAGTEMKLSHPFIRKKICKHRGPVYVTEI